MTTLLVILWVFLFIGFVLHHGVQPVRSRHSMFELKRRNEQAVIEREHLLNTVIAIRRLAELVIVVFLTAISLVLWQALGVVIVIAALIIGSALSQVRIIKLYATKIYEPLEKWLLETIVKWPQVRWITFPAKYVHHDPTIESPEHLLHLVDQAGAVLSGDRQTIIRNGLHWHTTTVASVMTPRKDIVSVKHSELLGPLVLDDLHKSGHNRFPVIKGSLDNAIGLLDITELLEVGSGKNSQTAEKSMSSQLLRIESDRTLPEVLELLQKSHSHMLVVIDTDGKTVGLVTLADITGSLLNHAE